MFQSLLCRVGRQSGRLYGCVRRNPFSLGEVEISQLPSKRPAPLHRYAQFSSVGVLQKNSEVSESKSAEKPRSFEKKVYESLATIFGYYTVAPQNIVKAKKIYERCYSHVINDSFAKKLDLPDTFQSWFSSTLLHVYLCMIRLKMGDDNCRQICKELTVVFWEDCEQRMRLAGVKNNLTVSSSLKELWDMFNGAVVAYDEGLLTEDWVLASALWRNITFLRGKPHEVAALTEYVRREIQSLDDVSIEDLIEKDEPLFQSIGPLLDKRRP
eukprot:Nk52_evm49s554 gene=Nk52_evmTU49s554